MLMNNQLDGNADGHEEGEGDGHQDDEGDGYLAQLADEVGKKAKEVQTGGETASHYYQRTNTASFTIQNVFVQIVKCICPNC